MLEATHPEHGGTHDIHVTLRDIEETCKDAAFAGTLCHIWLYTACPHALAVDTFGVLVYGLSTFIYMYIYAGTHYMFSDY